MAKRIAILGSTGSIGRTAIKVIQALGQDYTVIGLSGHRQVKLLAEQARQTHAKVVAVTSSDLAEEFRQLVEDQDVEVLVGHQGLVEMVQREDIDIVLSGLVGIAGLQAVLTAARMGKRLAIANKEPLVVAGHLLMSTARAHGSTILPVDSEHSAIFQAMQAGCRKEVAKIILTGSGGPFRNAKPSDLEHVTIQQALAHPIWNMGPKITIDSATMMNKALEIIEAQWLFDIDAARIEVLIHPESIVHSLVEFVDGSVIAQMALPDMALPIQYALTYPQRVAGISKRLDLARLGSLTFEGPDLNRFKALSLAYHVVRTGGTACAVFNAANEAAVEAFLSDKIRFTQIIELVAVCLEHHNPISDAQLGDLMEADTWARRFVGQMIAKASEVRITRP
ncbi:MAG: 1-deoxy-D-xylulose-5-phosphate reductoisomerase [Sedimentisphaerales bacterium]|jgi:1-deoxy-D-xylulose-5-phosphate reductoisomerase|nr:1-deoxy-D-xylulose-5-phosphate reductoisomerase [Sedimentisphaerales bacterium]